MSREEIIETVKSQKGILFATPAIVNRVMYRGRNIIAKNKEVTDADERGYYPVEWWIMSLTEAENAVRRDGEGLSHVLVKTAKGTASLLFRDAVSLAEHELVGTYKTKWPLTKILDIGGSEVVPSFCTCDQPPSPEVPSIPCHVHNGYTYLNEEGELVQSQPGKLEAYFFPPLNVAPYDTIVGELKPITRLGLKPGVTQEQCVEALKKFGQTDAFYELMQPYPILPLEGWTIRQGVVHAPGPYPTFEIQFAQDDFHLASWTLGHKVPEDKLIEVRHTALLRGIRNETEWVQKLLKWDLCTDPNFKGSFHRPIEVLDKGSWGSRFRIFFDEFYGEGFEVHPGARMERPATDQPYAGIVWSGKGSINGNALDASDNTQKEFLVVPNTLVFLESTGPVSLYIFTVFPLKV